MAKKKNPNNAPADYAIGWGKPPRSSQFKPGRSGNPGGRKKGSLNFKTVLKAVLESEIELSENGRKRKVPIVQAILLRQVQDALRGEHRSSNSLLDRYERHVGSDVEEAEEELSEEDRALVERVIDSLSRRISHGTHRSRGSSSAPHPIERDAADE